MVYEVHVSSESKTKSGDWATFSVGNDLTATTLKNCLDYIHERYYHSKSHTTIYMDKTDEKGNSKAVAIGRIYPYTDDDEGKKVRCRDWVTIRKVERENVPLASWPHMRKK